ncbi:MAG TPA: M28 family peptidase, partial [Gemmataceae bacterium]|nr:M28 family peptidase [Gemmataceae bacterium]
MVLRQMLWPWQKAALLSAFVLLGVRVEAANKAVEARLRKDITFLASDECEGRGVTTKGINLAADYIANEFKVAGLKPAGDEGSYFQPFTIRGYATLGSPNTLQLRGPLGQEMDLRLGVDFQVAGLSGAAKVSAPLVFIGYGATAKTAGYDDYKNVDASGKIVVVLRKTPRTDNPHLPFDGPAGLYHAELSTKIANAEQHHAAAVLLVSDRDTAKNEDRLLDFSYTSFQSGSKIPVVHVHRAIVDRLLQLTLGSTLREIEEDIDRDLKPRSAVLTGWTAQMETTVSRPATAVKNIVGVLEGSGPLAKETIVLGAHYDHLGYGGFGSLARNLKAKAIHYGADDNGSGTTTLIELARRFAAQPNRQGRRLVFIAFSAE